MTNTANHAVFFCIVSFPALLKRFGTLRSRDYEDMPIAYGTQPEMAARAREVLEGLQTVDIQGKPPGLQLAAQATMTIECFFQV